MTTKVEVDLQNRVFISVETDVYLKVEEIKEIENLTVEHAEKFRSDK